MDDGAVRTAAVLLRKIAGLLIFLLGFWCAGFSGELHPDIRWRTYAGIGSALVTLGAWLFAF